MNEGKFEQNFVWYEWSFVSPADMPSSDFGGGRSRTTRTEGDGRPLRGSGQGTGDVWDEERRRDGVQPWTT